MARNEIKKYYMSVEGHMEESYFEWLKKEINKYPNKEFDVSFYIRRKKPKSFVKGLAIIDEAEITHVIDYESNSEYHTTEFKKDIDEMIEAKKLAPNRVKSYQLGYTNFTFELWMILHKIDCYGPLVHRDHYLDKVNKAFNKNYFSLDDFKNQKEFSSILDNLSLSDVASAIDRAIRITGNNKENYIEQSYRKQKYFKENPSLSIHDVIIKIFKDIKIDLI